MITYKSKYTGEQVDEAVGKMLNGEDIPTKISQLENDSGFITINDVPVFEEYVTETELSQKGFLVGEETSEELDDVETNKFVKYVTQTLTETQRQQARNNIGAASTEYVLSLFNELKEMILSGEGGGGVVIPNAILDSAIINKSKLV